MCIKTMTKLTSGMKSVFIGDTQRPGWFVSSRCSLKGQGEPRNSPLVKQHRPYMVNKGHTEVRGCLDTDTLAPAM